MGLLRKGFGAGCAYFRNHLTTRKQRILFSLGLLILSFCLYLLISLLSIGRSTLALGALAKSYRQEKVCHEECSVWRQAQEKAIVVDLKLDLKKKRQKLVKRISNYWQAEGGDLEFKKELVHIMSLAYGEENRPEYLDDYLLDSKAEQSLIREIISQFNIEKISQQNLNSNLLNKIKNATSSQEKVEALKTLGKLNNDQEVNNYFFILSSDESLELKREAIKNISAVLDKKYFFTLSQLEIISNLVLALETDSRLRQDLVLLLGDYYLVFPIETEKIWRGVYVKKELDNISRLFSADNLNHLTGTDLILPEISSSEWESYYNK